METIKKTIQFVKDVAGDERIPAKDKKILAAMIALIISPVDLIPDWIPFIGILDDLLILALVLDYFFRLLDQEILLSHYPFGMKSFVALRRFARFIAVLTPSFIKDRIWEYKPSVYRS